MVAEIIPYSILFEAESRAVDEHIDNCLRELFQKKIHFFHAKAKELNAAKPFIAADHSSRCRYTLILISKIHHYSYGGTTPDDIQANHIRQHLRELCLKYCLSKKITLEKEQIRQIIDALLTHRTRYDSTILHWPLSEFIKQLEWKYGKQPVPSSESAPVIELKNSIIKVNSILTLATKLVERIEKLLKPIQPEVITSVRFSEADQFGIFANALLAKHPHKSQEKWERLLYLASKCKGSKPTKKFLSDALLRMNEIGLLQVDGMLTNLIEFVIDLKPGELEKKVSRPNREIEIIHVPGLIVEENARLLIGLIWICSPNERNNLGELLARLCVKSFTNIPTRGAALAAVGNACLLILSRDPSHSNLIRLARLRYQIRQPNARARIEKHLSTTANDMKLGLEEFEDQLVDECSLKDGQFKLKIDDHVVLISINNNSVSETWQYNERVLRSRPDEINEADRQKVREHVRKIKLTLNVQRQRLDQMYRHDRKLTWAHFEKYYLSHGLLGVLTKNLLWNVELNGVVKTYGFSQGQWLTLDGILHTRHDNATVSLWHPLFASDKEIQYWRNIFAAEKRQQPIRQLYRELYVLTDAEIDTETYSNRMAGHILRQHQFNALAKLRGWKYALQISADTDSLGEIASLHLYRYNLNAEFFIPQVNSEFPLSGPSGALTYVSTDAVRFMNCITGAPCRLADIPPTVFSEIMRDCDLFVGVAGIANDETWRDRGGEPVFLDYWEQASRAELSELAKTRRTILRNLLSSPPYNSVCSIEDRYVAVQGKLRKYKIHIGSGHVRTEPGFRFICIVPSRSRSNTLYLPFDGDQTLSIIISKIHLLMHDDQITDPKIRKQL